MNSKMNRLFQVPLAIILSDSTSVWREGGKGEGRRQRRKQRRGRERGKEKEGTFKRIKTHRDKKPHVN